MKIQTETIASISLPNKQSAKLSLASFLTVSEVRGRLPSIAAAVHTTHGDGGGNWVKLSQHTFTRVQSWRHLDTLMSLFL